jgi:hypothetical protein
MKNVIPNQHIRLVCRYSLREGCLGLLLLIVRSNEFSSRFGKANQ